MSSDNNYIEFKRKLLFKSIMNKTIISTVCISIPFVIFTLIFWYLHIPIDTPYLLYIPIWTIVIFSLNYLYHHEVALESIHWVTNIQNEYMENIKHD